MREVHRKWLAAWDLSLGLAAGLATLGLDLLLAHNTMGYAPVVSRAQLAAYLVAGALVALVLSAGSWVAKRRRLTSLSVVGLTAMTLYSAGGAERVFHQLSLRGSSAALPAAIVVGALCLAWALVMLWWSRSSVGLLLAALATAVGLAVNRNLLDGGLTTRSLAINFAIVATATGLAGVARTTRRPGRVAAASVCVVMATAGLRWVTEDTEPRPFQGPHRETHPNLVILVLDALRDDVFRDVVDHTEEGLAFRETLSEAAWFRQAIAAAPWTAPSVGSILTGLYPNEHGFGRGSPDLRSPVEGLSPAAKTLAERLREHGYQTVGLGANPILAPVSGIGRGFDRYRVFHPSTTKLPLLTFLSSVGILRDELYASAPVMRSHLARVVPKEPRGERPLFLWFHLMDPHSPLNPHPDLPADPGSEGLPYLNRLYRDEVRFTLLEVARVMRLLDSRLDRERTAVVVVSDHGEMLPSDDRSHLSKRYGHGHALSPELVRVPLVIRPPGGLPSTRDVSTLTSHVDLLGTVMGLLGLPEPQLGSDRQSLHPWLLEESLGTGQKGREFALVTGTVLGPPQDSLRTLDTAYVRYPEGDRGEELYDLLVDPRERHNLTASQPRAAAHFRKWLEDVQSTFHTLEQGPEARYDTETRERLRALGYTQ